MRTEVTVNLFNAIQYLKRDANGTYIEVAVKPYLKGVLVKKQYNK